MPENPLSSAPDVRAFDDIAGVRSRIYDGVKSAYTESFPKENTRYRLELSNVDYDEPEPRSLAAQKKAIITGKTLQRSLSGTWSLYDKASNQLVDRQQGRVAHVPHLTDRGTYILNGTEYSLANQMRLKPGVYTRKKENGELESHFNIMPGSGSSFRVHLEPETGAFYVQVGQSQVPLYPVLKALGIRDADMTKYWGRDLVAANQPLDNEKHVDKAWLKFTSRRAKLGLGDIDPSQPPNKAAELKAAFDAMQLDPDVTKSTLGHPHDKVTPEVLLKATQKLIGISKGTAETDDRDHIAYQAVMGPEDLFAERVRKDAGQTLRTQLWKSTFRQNLAPVLNHEHRTRQLLAAIQHSGLGQAIEESNPLDVFDQLHRISRMGEGGIPTTDAIPDESRAVQPSYLGFVDMARTSESEKAGVDNRVAYRTLKGADGKLYTPMLDAKGREKLVSSVEAADATIAFPGELAAAKKEGRPVRAMVRGRMQLVDPKDVNYELTSHEDMFSPHGHLVPLLSSIKTHRMLMTARMINQALPLEQPEAPLVQSARRSSIPNDSFERWYGEHAGAIRAKLPGVVTKVGKDHIELQTAQGKQRHELYDNMPLNRKTLVRNTPVVQPGQQINPGDLLATSNFTDNEGKLALGKNLRIGFLPYRGSTVEDAVVVSESAAKKLRSEHMYQHDVDLEPGQKISKKGYLATFPGVFTKAQLDNFDENGVIRPGTVVKKGDPLVLSMTKRAPKGQGVLHKSGKESLADTSELWGHEDEGVVTDVHVSPKQVNVVVKSMHHTGVGDKLSGRQGNKGVISKVVPDHLMPHDESGQPLEVIMHPFGLISRTNPSMAFEAALGKLAAKTGKPYVMPGFGDTNNVEFVRNELRRNGMSDTETVLDPETGRKIPNVFVGNMWLMKLHHMADDKLAARGDEGGYTADMVPSKGGGEDSAKRISNLETLSLLSAGAPAVLRDAKLVRGQRNDEFWRAFRMGYPPPSPQQPFVYRKFWNDLKAAGVNVEKRGNYMHLLALRDKDIDQMSRGEITKADTLDFDNMNPVQGGLFDMGLTGGHSGCFHPKVKVWTERGLIPIGDIVEQRMALRVWSYDFASAQFVLRPITNWFTNTAPDGIGCARFAAPGRLGSSLPRSCPTTLWGTATHQVFDINGVKHDLSAVNTLVGVEERLSYSQEQLLYGGLLGDATIDPCGVFSVRHCPAQLPYLQWTASVFAPIGSRITEQRAQSWGVARLSYGWRARHHVAFHRARQLCYPNNVKTVSREWLAKIDELGLAVWYMDDGSINRDKTKNTLYITLHTEGFTRSCVALLQDWLRERWGLSSSVGRKAAYEGRSIGYELRLSGLCAQAFLELVAPYIHEALRYKLGVQPNLATCSRCSVAIAARRRICNTCAMAEARSCAGHKLPKHIRRLFNGTATVRAVLAASYIPRDRNIAMEAWSRLQAMCGTKSAAVASDTAMSFALASIPSVFTANTGHVYERTRTVYDITVDGTHNYFANGILVSNSGWSHVAFKEPMPNPVFEDSIRRVLGLTEPKFRDIMGGKQQLDGDSGGRAIQSALRKINVPREIEVQKQLVRTGSKSRRDDAIKRLRVLTMLSATGIKPEELVLNKAPVLPPMFRPISRAGKLTIVSDPNLLYKELMLANEHVGHTERELGRSGAGDAHLALYDSFKALTGLADPLQPKLSEKGVRGILSHALGIGASPKFSAVQRKLIGSATDLVGRGVITPNPSLDMDQVGLPEDKAWTLYRPFIIRDLVRRGAPAMQAATMAANKDPRAKDALLRAMDERPVIINRAPTLHRYGIMAAKPVLTASNTLEVPPVICTGMSADFDGDAMQFHVPVSDDAVAETKQKLLPSKNLRSVRFFDAHYLPIQEYLHGLWTATHKHSDKPVRTFTDEKAVEQAYRRGEIGVNDRVELMNRK